MLHTVRSKGAMITAPHHLAAQSGLAVMREGGNAIEAMIAAAATIAVVYPHMNAIGGDGFWLIAEPGQAPVGIDACGPAARLADSDFYKAHGVSDAIPARGGLAALTVAGTIAGWDAARALAQQAGGRLPLNRLLADAIHHAREGIVITDSMAAFTASKRAELVDIAGFADVFLPQGRAPDAGDVLHQPRLADTLDQLSRAGLRDFYEGDIARALAADMEAAGSPVRLSDLEDFSAQQVAPISVALDAGALYNMPPPTQGLASLLILAIYERLRADEADSFDHVHRIVEAIKRAFFIRDAHVTDPRFASADPAGFPHAPAHRRRSRGDRHAGRAARGPRRRRAAKTRSGWGRWTRMAGRSASSSRSTGNTARASCRPRPACSGRTAASASRSTRTR